jgi:lysyl-tRNA synthetase class 2
VTSRRKSQRAAPKRRAAGKSPGDVGRVASPGNVTRIASPRNVASPSDIATGNLHRHALAVVGGRVIAVRARNLVLADALSTLHVSLGRGEGQELAPGDIVRMTGKLEGKRLMEARVIEHARGRAPSANSEFGRFALDGIGARLAARARALAAVRAYFEERDFIEVETPVRVASPGLDAHVDAIRAEDGFLITSPELHMKRLLVGGLPRVYQLAKVSRAGEHGALHEPEFTMLEWYRAFSGIEAVIADAESLVAIVVEGLGAAKARKRRRVVAPDGRAVDVVAPFRRITVREAFRAHAGVDDAADLAATDPDRYYRIFVDSVEPALAREPSAFFLWQFPITEAALARPCAADPTVAERFELYAGGVELCNGFGELTDPAEQRRRFEAERARRARAGAPQQPIDEAFLLALEEGMPPAGGNALGFDRLVMLALGASRIAEVMAFPRVK